MAFSRRGGGTAHRRRRPRVAGLIRRDSPEPAGRAEPDPVRGALSRPGNGAGHGAVDGAASQACRRAAEAAEPDFDRAAEPDRDQAPERDRDRAAEPGATEPPREVETASPADRRRLVRAALAGVAVVAAGLAVWFGLSAHAVGGIEAARNTALVDVATTNAVSTQVGEAVRAAFSYDYTNPATTRQAAQNVLTGHAIDEYNQLFAQVERDAPAQKLMLTTTVRSVGVIQVDGDHARALVFVDQQALRADSSQSNSGAAQLDVVAVRTGTTWKISDLTVL
ncbi:hypothetical protein [Gandjariella thermophila]|uniref:Mce-associated membrane protein n=1 Tax=Gandjariella thermophila TaxID=1931992 RepID=A0A4D4J208_9PSEU|nr:hypothetical protein [Gandjariella thermophila]GDY29132.1 hypothetical protein GTS_07650 [Gandjariella thermophila]